MSLRARKNTIRRIDRVRTAPRTVKRLFAALLVASLAAGCATSPPPEPPPAPPPPDYGPTNFEAIPFGAGRVNLSPDAEERVRLIAVRLARPDVVDKTVVVAGHTDSRGAANRNREMSMRRAESVLNVLTTNGINRNRVRLVAFGEDQPLGDNATREGRAMNRRVEISLEP